MVSTKELCEDPRYILSVVPDGMFEWACTPAALCRQCTYLYEKLKINHDGQRGIDWMCQMCVVSVAFICLKEDTNDVIIELLRRKDLENIDLMSELNL